MLFKPDPAILYNNQNKMSYYTAKPTDAYFSSALLVYNSNPINKITHEEQYNYHTSPSSRSHSIESSSMNNCLSKDLLRRLNSISPLEKRRQSNEPLANLSQESETEFQLIEVDSDSKDLSGLKHISEGSYFNINKARPNKKKKKKTKKNLNNINDEYITEMFGRRGWICQQCHNFNYESRIKCNRCTIPKIAKRLIPKQEPEQQLPQQTQNQMQQPLQQQQPQHQQKQIPLQKYDWICSNCFNFNYSFRQICNRCQGINTKHALIC